MDIQKILDYQNIDQKYFEIENKLKHSDVVKKRSQYQQYGKNAADELQKLARTAEELLLQYEKSFASLTEAEQEFGELSGDIDDNDIKAIEYYMKSLEKLQAQTDAVQREIFVLSAQIDSVKKQIDTEQKKYYVAGKELSATEEEFKALKATLQSDAKVVLKEMKELEPTIDQTLLTRYKKVRAERKRLPVIAPLRDSVCTACGMDLAADVVSKFTSDNPVQECPNCGVLIFRG